MKKLIRFILYLLLIISILALIYGAFRYLKNFGNSNDGVVKGVNSLIDNSVDFTIDNILNAGNDSNKNSLNGNQSSSENSSSTANLNTVSSTRISGDMLSAYVGKYKSSNYGVVVEILSDGSVFCNGYVGYVYVNDSNLEAYKDCPYVVHGFEDSAPDTTFRWLWIVDLNTLVGQGNFVSEFSRLSQ